MTRATIPFAKTVAGRADARMQGQIRNGRRAAAPRRVLDVKASQIIDRTRQAARRS
jgi:hypothetical protein